MVWEVKHVPFYLQGPDGLPGRAGIWWSPATCSIPTEMKFFVSNASPETSVGTILLAAFSRWRVERCFDQTGSAQAEEPGESGRRCGHQTITSDTAAAASILPMLSSRKTVVGRTSVRIRVAPEKTRIGPNSPSDRAQASVAAVSMPRRASGKTTIQNAWLRLHPRVRATCSERGLIWSNVTRIVRTANAQATVNWARTTLGTAKGDRDDPLDRPAQRRLEEDQQGQPDHQRRQHDGDVEHGIDQVLARELEPREQIAGGNRHPQRQAASRACRRSGSAGRRSGSPRSAMARSRCPSEVNDARAASRPTIEKHVGAEQGAQAGQEEAVAARRQVVAARRRHVAEAAEVRRQRRSGGWSRTHGAFRSAIHWKPASRKCFSDAGERIASSSRRIRYLCCESLATA